MKNNVILVSILILAALLRFWKLDSYPALNADEAAIGYNAYSLIQTGRDEHGNPWPIHFQSFNDYKPGLYFYLVLPFVKVLGLSVWAVRIPGALIGVLTVYAVYLLVRDLKFRNSLENGKCLPAGEAGKMEILASAMLAISPWHIHFSRGGWEVNTATFFITAAVWLFLKGRKNPKFLVLSSLAFAASLYTYHASRIVVPLMGLGILIFFWKDVKNNLKSFITAGLIGLFVLLPLLKDLTEPAGVSRAAGVGLFADTGPLARINEQRGEHGDYTSLQAKVLHNKAVNYALAFLQNWSAHFHGEFLFLSGDVIQRNRVPETGQLYFFDLLWIVIGLGLMVKKWDKETKFILWWLVVAPTAAALTFQSPHALRAHNMVIPLTLISAFGISKALEVLTMQKKWISSFGILALAILTVLQFVRYEHMYWVHLKKEYPFSSQYGVKELVSFIKENNKDYGKVIVTNRYDQPYILFLFYLKYPPGKFQEEHFLTSRDGFGFSTVRAFDKYEFRSINYDVDQPENPGSLIIGTDEEIPDEANIIKEIYGSNDYKYFEIVAN